MKADFSLVAGSNWGFASNRNTGQVLRNIVYQIDYREYHLFLAEVTHLSLLLHSPVDSQHKNAEYHLSLVLAQWDLPMH